MKDGLESVAAAVIYQAIDDARPGGATKDTARATADLFLVGDSRGWAESRRRWFALAGLHVPSRDLLEKAVRGERAA